MNIIAIIPARGGSKQIPRMLWHRPGLCPVAEAAYAKILSLPMFPGMTDGDVDRVIAAVTEIIS